jgi:hypothetical protein
VTWILSGSVAAILVGLAGALELDKKLRWAWERRRA